MIWAALADKKGNAAHQAVDPPPKTLQPDFMHSVISLSDLDAIRNHVLEKLCEHDLLDPAETPLHEVGITRRGRACGIFFQVQGPRRVKNYAVWASDEGRILFYDSLGVRYGETRVVDGPAAPRLAA
jgi:hypothetical protein